jgi:hypothetical protein
MTFSDGTPSTVSEELAARRRIRQDGPFRVREHRGFGHGLAPGTDRDINCGSCTREDRNYTPCPDCGGGYWQEYIGPPLHEEYITHASICPVVAS